MYLTYLWRANQALRSGVFARFDRGIWIITAVDLLTTASFSICIPFLSLYLYQERELPMTLIGAVLLGAGIAGAITQVIGGGLSDKFGRRPVILGTVGIRTVWFLVLAALIQVSAPIWAIVITYITARAAGSISRPMAAAIVADLSPKSRSAEAYGVLRVGRNVGWAAGPAIGGYLAIFLSYGWLFAVAAAISALALCFIFFFFRETFQGATDHVGLRSMVAVATDWGFLAFIGLSLLVFLGMGQLGSTLSVFTVECIGISTAQYGLLLTTNGLLVIFFQYPVSRGINHLGKRRALILGAFLYGLGYIALSWALSFSWILVSIAIITLGEIVFSPTALSVAGELSPTARRGHYMGFLGLSETLAISIGPLVGGALLDAFTNDPLFIWGPIALLMFVAVLGFCLWMRRY